jgi:hypothetical protein
MILTSALSISPARYGGLPCREPRLLGWSDCRRRCEPLWIALPQVRHAEALHHHAGIGAKALYEWQESAPPT